MNAQEEIADKTRIRVAGKIGDIWHGYVVTEKGVSLHTCIDGPVGIQPGGEYHGIKYDAITGPGEYTVPE
jgi:hypothetical protein